MGAGSPVVRLVHLSVNEPAPPGAGVAMYA